MELSGGFYNMSYITTFSTSTSSISLIAGESSILATPSATILQIAGISGVPTRMVIDTSNDNDRFGSSLRGRRTRGTFISPSAIGADDVMFQIIGDGYDGTDIATNGVSMVFFASETWNTASHGTYTLFRTTQNGSTGSKERLRIDHNGNIYISQSVFALGFSGSFTGSLLGTASFSQTSISASYAPMSPVVSASYALSASYTPSSPSTSASYSLTASYVTSASYAPSTPSNSASYALTASYAESGGGISLPSSGTINFNINNNGRPIMAGNKGNFIIGSNININSWTLICNTTGSISVEVLKSTYSTYPTFVSITNGNFPSVTSLIKSQSMVNNWSSSLSSNDILNFYVTSSDGVVSELNLILQGIKYV